MKNIEVSKSFHVILKLTTLSDSTALHLSSCHFCTDPSVLFLICSFPFNMLGNCDKSFRNNSNILNSKRIVILDPQTLVLKLLEYCDVFYSLLWQLLFLLFPVDFLSHTLKASWILIFPFLLKSVKIVCKCVFIYVTLCVWCGKVGLHRFRSVHSSGFLKYQRMNCTPKYRAKKHFL